jgi:hypothetical protein
MRGPNRENIGPFYIVRVRGPKHAHPGPAFLACRECFGAAHTRLPLGPLLHASTVTASNLAIMLCTGPQADFPVRDVYVAVAQRGVS